MNIEKLISLLILFLPIPFLSAQSTFEIKNIEMTIDGTSSLHNWTSEVTEVTARGSLHVEDGALLSIDALEVSIPVASIKSSRGKVMDDKTFDAFKMADHPHIIYELTEVTSMTPTTGSEFDLAAKGVLTMAGISRPVDLKVMGKIGENGAIRFEGSRQINMTDFEMIPPTAMFGTLKTGETITINFKLTLSNSKS